MATVHIPAMLQYLTGGAATVAAPGSTLRAVMAEVERQHPTIRGRVVEEGAVRPEVFLVVGAEEAFGLDMPIADDAEVHIVPAIAGGA